MHRFVEFDFGAASVREIDATAVGPSMSSGKFVWLDLADQDLERSRALLLELLPNVRPVVDAVLGEGHDTAFTPFAEALHFSVVSCRLDAEGLRASRVDALVGERFFVTVSREPVGFLESLRREYREDFVRFAKTPSFLIYEFFDHLTRGHEQVRTQFEHEVSRLHSQVLARIDDEALEQVSRVGSDLLLLRRHVAPTRSVLHELATRRSAFVSEIARPYLDATVGALDRVLGDITADREILSDSLNLAVSLIGYRTNQVINRLTVLSFVFLPLTFLCSVYGMNFEHQPEFKWRYGYLMFWAVAALVTLSVLLFIRRNRHAGR